MLAATVASICATSRATSRIAATWRRAQTQQRCASPDLLAASQGTRDARFASKTRAAADAREIAGFLAGRWSWLARRAESTEAPANRAGVAHNAPTGDWSSVCATRKAGAHGARAPAPNPGPTTRPP